MIDKTLKTIILFLLAFTSAFASETFTSTINLAVEVIYHQEIERAMKYAPPGKTNSQLRREAQKKSNAVFQKAARIYKIRVLRPKLVWGFLRDSAAGQAGVCFDSPFIWMNEILFLHNFDDTLNENIPHEVAHVVTCLVHPEIAEQEDFDTHGSEWQTIAKSLGSSGEKYHTLDTTPTAIYMVRVELLDAEDQAEMDQLQGELDALIADLEKEEKDE